MCQGMAYKLPLRKTYKYKVCLSSCEMSLGAVNKNYNVFEYFSIVYQAQTYLHTQKFLSTK